MKKIKFFIPFFLFFVILTSCQKDEVNDLLLSSSQSEKSAKITSNGVLKEYPSYLISTPLIDYSEEPSEVVEFAQSPIDIQSNQTANIKSATPDINYGEITLSEVENLGGNLEVKLSEGDKARNTVMIEDKEYLLNQLHFHHHSEHTVNGKYSKMEIHFVNISDDNSYAVLSVLVEFGSANATLQTIFDASPETKEESPNETEEVINLKDLIPKNISKYYTYSGSLTTDYGDANNGGVNDGPVTWIVFKDKQKISFGQLEEYKEIYPLENFRDVQELYGRTVYVNIGNEQK
jgi:carbonic anhydrase